MTDNSKQSTRPGYPFRLGRLDPPEAVREIVARLERAGFECWCVGGAVRDALLGHPHLDWDFATIATPAQVMGVFKRTVPVGVEFGTVGVFDSQNTMHEVTTFRRDVNTDGRHAVVEFGASLDDDLARRDFTVNAIAYHPQRDELRDPFEGQLDLRRGLIRAVGTRERADARGPAARAARDPLCVAVRVSHRAGDLGRHQGFRAAHGPALARAREAGTREDDGAGGASVDRARVVARGGVSARAGSVDRRRAGRAVRGDRPFAAGGEDSGEGEAGKGGVPRAEGGAGKGATLSRLAMLFFGERETAVAAATKALRFSNADSAWIASLAGSRAELGERWMRRSAPGCRRPRTCAAGWRGSAACARRRSSR